MAFVTTDQAADAAIRDELRQLGELYGLATATTEARLAELGLGIYAEIVLAEHGFEVVVGGVGQEAALVDLAHRLAFPTQLIDAFEHSTALLPEKMLYTKVPIGLDVQPSMYVCAIEPWSPIFEVLARVEGMTQALPALRAGVRGRSICFIVGFTYAAELGCLTAKTYHLVDRPPVDHAAPTLISHRLGCGTLLPDTKHYVMNVGWSDLAGAALPVDGAREIFGDGHAMMTGSSRSSSESTTKLYVFRHDARLQPGQHLSRYNYYADEGMKLLQLGDHHAAVEAFSDAVAFLPTDAAAHNALGYAHIQLQQYSAALEACAQARAIDPTISPANMEFAAGARAS